MIQRIWSVTLTVSDLERAADFYENTLGLEKKYHYKDYAGFDCGGVEIGLKTWGELEPPRAGEPSLDLLVEDLEGTMETLRSRGVVCIRGPEEASWGGRFALFQDPDGHTLQLTRIDWPRYFAANAQG